MSSSDNRLISPIHTEIRRGEFLDMFWKPVWKINGVEFNYFYLTVNRKIIFVEEPNDDNDGIELRGYYIQLYKYDKAGMKELTEETNVVKITRKKFNSYLNKITNETISKYARKHHMPFIKKVVRIYVLKWNKIYNEQENEHGTNIFRFLGYSRHRDITTGSIWGFWIS